jgi:hypothetical protein
MWLLGLSSDTWIGFVGVLVGGCFTLLGQLIANAFQGKAKKKEERRMAEATALLIQDDFLHYQSTLARSLDACRWWEGSWLLVRQAWVEDRRTVWIALNAEQTRVVADAQGWMDYLIGRRREFSAPSAPALESIDVETMQQTFRYLDDGRRALAGLANCPATEFEGSPVMKQLERCKTVDELLAR